MVLYEKINKELKIIKKCFRISYDITSFVSERTKHIRFLKTYRCIIR